MRRRGSVLVPRLAPLEADCLVRLLHAIAVPTTETVQPDTVAVVVVLPHGRPPQPLSPPRRPDGSALPLLLVVPAVEPHTVALARAVGACGIHDLHADPDPLLNSIRSLLVGGPVRMTPGAVPDRFGSLTERERDVVALAAAATPEPEIGRRLGISPQTVHAHLAHVQRKLGVERAEDAATLVRDNVRMKARMRELSGWADELVADR